MQDVVVLQFGPYANYVGAHFWNCQVRHGHLCDVWLSPMGM